MARKTGVCLLQQLSDDTHSYLDSNDHSDDFDADNHTICASDQHAYTRSHSLSEHRTDQISHCVSNGFTCG